MLKICQNTKTAVIYQTQHNDTPWAMKYYKGNYICIKKEGTYNTNIKLTHSFIFIKIKILCNITSLTHCKISRRVVSTDVLRSIVTIELESSFGSRAQYAWVSACEDLKHGSSVQALSVPGERYYLVILVLFPAAELFVLLSASDTVQLLCGSWHVCDLVSIGLVRLCPPLSVYPWLSSLPQPTKPNDSPQQLAWKMLNRLPLWGASLEADHSHPAPWSMSVKETGWKCLST